MISPFIIIQFDDISQWMARPVVEVTAKLVGIGDFGQRVGRAGAHQAVVEGAQPVGALAVAAVNSRRVQKRRHSIHLLASTYVNHRRGTETKRKTLTSQQASGDPLVPGSWPLSRGQHPFLIAPPLIWVKSVIRDIIVYE